MAKESSKSGLKLEIKLSDETSEKLKTISIQQNLPDNNGEKPKEPSEKEIMLGKNEKIDLDKIDDSVNKSSDEKISSNLEVQLHEDYTEHIHYEENVAIYTDPLNKQQYVWCNSTNNWVFRMENKDNNSSDDVSVNDEITKNNVSYGFEDNKHTYTDADGAVYFWDEDKNAWFPKVDDEFLAHYQMSYGFVDNTSSKDEMTKNEIKPDQNVIETNSAIKRKPEEPKWFDVSEDQNTKVYVSNLPLDVTEEEFVDLMQKCGLVMKDPTTQKMKVKLYTKPNSQQLKGDGLCTYIKVESVELALKILDGYLIRDHRIGVQRAKFQMKGDFNPALKPKKKKKKDLEKLKKMQEKLFDWRPEKMRGERSKHERIIIVKNLFEPSLFDAEVHLILEYQQDLREECSKCGTVKKVTLYDRHPEGVAQIIMNEPEEAESVVKLINGRWFGKRQLSASIWDGKTKYKMEETDADINKRIDGWNKFLDDDETPSKSE